MPIEVRTSQLISTSGTAHPHVNLGGGEKQVINLEWPYSTRMCTQLWQIKKH